MELAGEGADAFPHPEHSQLIVFLILTGLVVEIRHVEAGAVIADGHGELVPVRYHQGDLALWWSVPGDASGDSLVTVADAVFLVNYLYRHGPEPCMCEAADCNSDCLVDLGDLVYLLGYLFRGGRDPLPGCAHCPHEDCRPE